MAQALPAYRKLLKRAREISLLSSTSDLLGWDEETYLPLKALDHRAEQMAYLGGRAHRLFTATQVGQWISECEQHGFAADSDEATNVREWRRSYDRKTKIPARLVEKFARTRSHAREAWGEARKQSKFKLFKPHFQKLLDLHLQFADLWGYTGSPYNAHLDEYEPGARADDMRSLFAQLRPEIVSILGPAVERSKATPRSILNGHYPVTAQQALNREVATAMGFDFNAGRIDTTTHPFCPARARMIAGSPRGTARKISPSRSTASCTRPATASTIRACPRSTTAPPSAAPSRWASTNPNRGCGKTMSVAVRLSGSTGIPSPANIFPS